jgi:hypothetical protein
MDGEQTPAKNDAICFPHRSPGGKNYPYARIGAAPDEEAEKLYVSADACESRHLSFSNYLTVELTALKELSLELAKLFGITI